ncbi:hypothetical protein MP228_010469 [Amoeboaphelidium protococcarum]|nr:hypothetical protein MP228_010469 [Amoeboaphelidium protococcarum]
MSLLVPQNQKSKRQQIQEFRQQLPIYQYKDDLVQAIKDHQILIIVAQTGSGKSTQIPQYLHEAGFTADGKRIGCSQPRRVATMSIAERVSEEFNCRLGRQVGYCIRFEDKTSEDTVIKFMTDGMLLREFMNEPDLASYSALIIDEAHERTLATDILFALVKDVCRFRPEFRLIISSATMNADKFSKYFDDAPIFNVPGRRYPVDVFYSPESESDYVTAAIGTVLQIHISQPVGDILVFLTGQDEIETMAVRLQEEALELGESKIGPLMICPIYSTLPPDQQQKIFDPTPRGYRKVVIATNIAESSITIDGVVYVVDCGYVKEKQYNARTGMEQLVVVPCSKASADQRKGRAGRVSAGKCFRLYTLWTYDNEMPQNQTPEIQRSNLSNVVLLLKSMGISDLINFEFMDPPSPKSLAKALELLYALGALNEKGLLTKSGMKMADLPVDPMMSKAILASEKYGCVEDVVIIVSLLSVQNSLFLRPKGKLDVADSAHRKLYSPSGDHVTLLNVWQSWAGANYSTQWCYQHFIQYKALKMARDVRSQLMKLIKKIKIEVVTSKDITEGDGNAFDDIRIRKALLSGYFTNISQLQLAGDCYKTLKLDQSVYIHPSSCLFTTQPPLVFYYELVLTSKEYMRQVSAVDIEWLREIAPHYYRKADALYQSQSSSSVVSKIKKPRLQ